MNWVGMMIAGDGVVEATILFDSREEAEQKMNTLLVEEFDPSFDRVHIGLAQTYEAVVEDMRIAKQDS